MFGVSETSMKRPCLFVSLRHCQAFLNTTPICKNFGLNNWSGWKLMRFGTDLGCQQHRCIPLLCLPVTSDSVCTCIYIYLLCQYLPRAPWKSMVRTCAYKLQGRPQSHNEREKKNGKKTATRLLVGKVVSNTADSTRFSCGTKCTCFWHGKCHSFRQ